MKEILEIYLAATNPDEDRYGFMPQKPSCPDNDILSIQFPYEVWYNEEWRDTTMRIIRPKLRTKNILIGFSKSGLGALNIAIENPGIFHAVVIFDSPLMHQDSNSFNLKEVTVVCIRFICLVSPILQFLSSLGFKSFNRQSLSGVYFFGTLI